MFPIDALYFSKMIRTIRSPQIEILLSDENMQIIDLRSKITIMNANESKYEELDIRSVDSLNSTAVNIKTKHQASSTNVQILQFQRMLFLFGRGVEHCKSDIQKRKCYDRMFSTQLLKITTCFEKQELPTVYS